VSTVCVFFCVFFSIEPINSVYTSSSNSSKVKCSLV
jgi:hypothetical protein